MSDTRQQINDQEELNNSLRSYLTLLQDILAETGKKITLEKQTASEVSKLQSATLKIAQQQEGINRLTDRQLDKEAQKAKIAEAELIKLAEQIDRSKELSATQQELVDYLDKKKSGEIDILGGIEKQVAQRKEANKAMGVAGALLKGLNGLSPEFSKGLKLNEVIDEMQEFADKAADAGGSVSRLQTLGVGLKSAYLNLGDTLTDPTVLLTSMVKGFGEVDKAATSFQQMTGENMNTMSTSLNLLNDGLITTAELIGAAGDVTKEFGINANAAFSIDEMSEIASMKKEMGLAGNEAAKLARLSKVNGSNIEDQNKSIIEGVKSGNAQNRTAVATGVVLRDIANLSEGIAISYAGYPEKLAEAATSARALGMTLSDMDNIANSLLQFESSIAAEMEAELLTGKSLNLERARELALSNDLNGLAKELGSQGITTASFSKMNRIQQEAQAKALGMSRDAMAKMLMQQGLSLGMSTKGLSDAQKAALEDMKRVDAQEKIATAVAKLQQALAPIVELFANIVTNGWVIYSVMGVALLAKMPMLVSSVKGLAGGFGSAWKNAKGLISGTKSMLNNLKGSGSLMGKMYKGGQFMPGGGRAAAGGQRAGGLMGKIKGAFSAPKSIIPKDTDKVNKLSKDVKPGAGKGLKENLQGLAAGLRSMGTGPVAKGALNLGIFGIAAIPSIASIPFLLFMGLTPLTLLKTNMQSLAAGLRSMGTGNVLKGVGSLSLLALAGVLMIPGSVGLLMFGGVSYVAAAGIYVLIPALEALGAAMATGVGALGLIALVGAAIGLGAAFALVGVGALAMGKGISLAAEGFSMMVPHILTLVSSIPALFLLGGALLSVGAGLGLIATSGTLAIPSLLALGVTFSLIGVGALAMGKGIQLAAQGFSMMVPHILSLVSVIPSLFLLGGALVSIGIGLASIATAGTLAIPALLALGAVGMVAGSLFGGDNENNESSEKSSMAGVEAKLDQLISIVSAGGDVYLDGSKVGKTLQLSTFKMG